MVLAISRPQVWNIWITHKSGIYSDHKIATKKSGSHINVVSRSCLCNISICKIGTPDCLMDHIQIFAWNISRSAYMEHIQTHSLEHIQPHHLDPIQTRRCSLLTSESSSVALFFVKAARRKRWFLAFLKQGALHRVSKCSTNTSLRLYIVTRPSTNINRLICGCCCFILL